MVEPVLFYLTQGLVFLFGAVLGSFYNVCIHRIPRSKYMAEDYPCPHCGEEITWFACPHCKEKISEQDLDEEPIAESKSMGSTRSRCPKCGHLIRWYDNVPVLSWLILRGKCRDCGQPIPIRYPVVELAAGLFALACFSKFGPNFSGLAFFLFISILIIISFIDLDTFRIPVILTIPVMLAGLAASVYLPNITFLESLAGALYGAGGMYLLRQIYFVVRRVEGMGGGDVDLMAMIGAFTGWQGVVFTVVSASVIGMLVGLVLMAMQNKGLKLKVPFGPFLSMGALLYLFYGTPLIAWYITLLTGQ